MNKYNDWVLKNYESVQNAKNVFIFQKNDSFIVGGSYQDGVESVNDLNFGVEIKNGIVTPIDTIDKSPYEQTEPTAVQSQQVVVNGQGGGSVAAAKVATCLFFKNIDYSFAVTVFIDPGLVTRISNGDFSNLAAVSAEDFDTLLSQLRASDIVLHHLVEVDGQTYQYYSAGLVTSLCNALEPLQAKDALWYNVEHYRDMSVTVADLSEVLRSGVRFEVS